MTTEQLTNAYKWRRQVYFGTPATRTLQLARADVAANIKRYPLSVGWNQPDAGGLRWLETIQGSGLRDVGPADQVRPSISHKGWYIDDSQSDTYRGAVLQLPARNGRPVFLAAYTESANDGYRVDCSTLYIGEDSGGDDAKRDAAHAADELARVEAEKAREWNEAFQNGQRYTEHVDAAKETSRERRDLQKEYRKAIKLGLHKTNPGIVAPMVKEIAALYAYGEAEQCKALHLRDEFHYSNEHIDAFNDGAGGIVLAKRGA